MRFEIPESLKHDHEELHAELEKAVRAGGQVGEAARAVAEALHPHFVKEEEYAMPPLGILSAISQGRVTPEMKDVISMTDRLKADLPHMLDEHKAIIALLKNLTSVAKKEDKMEHAAFAEKLMMHAKNEEEVLYPAAILVGEYLKEKLK